MLLNQLALSLVLGRPSLAAPPTSYLNWSTFEARGVNLGGWLHQEAVIDPVFWSEHGGDAFDEWDLCSGLGSACGPVLEQRYATYITTEDIDALAATGINLLRIPTGYSAWVEVPGDHHYTGRQVEHLRAISDYSIARHGMHVIVDIHSHPGGVNGMGLGGREGGYAWFHNETALEYSYHAVDAAIEFIQAAGYPQGFTLQPMNEPVDNGEAFGTPDALSDEGAEWVLSYFQGVLERVESADQRIPVLLQGSFKGEEFWSPHFDEGANIAFDVHHYYFAGRPTTSENISEFICSDAQGSPGDNKFPVLVGEWSIQAVSDNTFSSRAANLNTGLRAWEEYTRGSCYWTYRFSGNEEVDGEGVQGDYWSYETFIAMYIIDPSSCIEC